MATGTRNKCLNEKRRREQENIYMEELAELLSASITDMSNFSSVKPDKCAILQETVNQIRRIKTEEGDPSDVIQQSQVSSSKPTILNNDVLGPLLLEALDGFLFVVNSQGKVEFVSDNVSQYLKYSQDDWINKSIYNFIHVGDHAQFSGSLLPMSSSVGSHIQWPADNSGTKSRTFHCRMLFKPPGDEQDEDSEYENMQITAVLQPYPCEADAVDSSSPDASGQLSCLVCIARRTNVSEKNPNMLGIEQFTTKQDLAGKVLACDTSGISPNSYTYPDFIGLPIKDFCHLNDQPQLDKHHSEVLVKGSNTSGVYRFKLADNRYVFVQTKSKLFNNPNTKGPEFIMSTHSIVRECDNDSELKGSASTSLMKSIIGQTGNTKRGLLGNQLLKQPNMLACLSASTHSNSAMAPLLGSMRNNSPLPNDISDVNLDLPHELSELLFTSNNSMWGNMLDNNKGQQHSNGGPSTPGTSPYSMAISSSMNTPMTQVSWTNASPAASPSVMANMRGPMGARGGPLHQQMGMQNQHQRGHPHNNMMGMKSPISPMFTGQQSPGFAPGQRSPGYAPSPGCSQRSPASVGSMGSSQMPGFHRPHTPGTNMMAPSPRGMVSSSSLGLEDDLAFMLGEVPSIGGTLGPMTTPPTGKITQHQGMPNTNPLQALVSLEAQAGSNLANQLRLTPQKKAKLKQLLSNQSAESPGPGGGVNNISGQSNGRGGGLTNVNHLQHHQQSGVLPTSAPNHTLNMGAPGKDYFNTSGGDHTSQSPAHPSSALSSPQQPQSTSADDHPDSSSRGENPPSNRKHEENAILKQLLEQDEEGEKPGADGDKMSADKNEAEPKSKKDHKLLKQLLNEDTAKENKGKVRKSRMLLQKLLLEDDPDDNDTQPTTPLVPVPKTPKSCDTERPRSRPPSTTTPQSTTSDIDDSIFSLLQNSLPTSIAANSASGANKSANSLHGSQLDKFLSRLWDKQTEEPMDNANGNASAGKRGTKRKMSDVDHVDSTENVDSMDSTGGPGSAKPSQKNVLLAKLLSSHTPNETVVNTQHSVNATSVPQNKLPRNVAKIADKINEVAHPENNSTVASVQGSDRLTQGVAGVGNKMNKTQSGQKPTAWDNPRTNPNSPFPGNTRDMPGSSNQNTGMMGMGGAMNTQQQQQQQQQNAGQMSSAAVSSSSPLGGVTSSSDNVFSDPLLSQIIKEATELKEEQEGQLPSNFPDPNINILSELESVLSNSNLAEIDSIIGALVPPTSASGNPTSSAGGAQGGGNPFAGSDINEQMAIDAIQKQLMQGTTSSAHSDVNMPQGQGQQGMNVITSSPQTMSGRQQSMGGAMNPNMMGGAQGGPNKQQDDHMLNMDPQLRQQLLQLQQQQAAQQQAAQQRSQQPGFSQMMFNQQQQQHGPRFSEPNASTSSGFISPQPGTPTGSQTAIRNKLLQQRMNMKREQQQRQQQAQQQQQSRQFPGQFGSGTGQPPGMPSHRQGQPGYQQMPSPISENFSELMNTNMAPNVSLQRNQVIPGPMSPRFQSQMGPQGPQVGPGPQGNMGMMGPRGASPANQRLSPFASQNSGAPQWSQRSSQTMMTGGAVAQLSVSKKGSQFGGNMGNMGPGRGATMGPHGPRGPQQPTSIGGPQNPMNISPGSQHSMDGNQFSGQGNQMGMLSPQQQQQMMLQQQQQNRMIRMNMSGGPMGSPRGGQSPFGSSGQDPHLMSPHQKLSPNHPQQQMSQGFPQQPGLSPAYSQGGTSPGSSVASPQVAAQQMGQNFPMNTTVSGANMPQQPNFQQGDPMFSPGAMQQKSPQLGQSGPQQSINSQYVKNELRGLISNRTQNQQPGPGHNQPSVSDPLAGFSADDGLPMEVLDTLNELVKQPLSQGPPSHSGGPQGPGPMGGPRGGAGPMDTGPPVQEDNILMASREEAHRRYTQFRQLANTGQVPPKDAETKATNLFRNQLLTKQLSTESLGGTPQQQPQQPGGKKQEQPNVVQTEPRTPVDDIKPADQKNSLLQQLLSDTN